MRLRAWRGCAGFREWRLSSSAMWLVVLSLRARRLHRDEVGDLAELALELRPGRVLGGPADLAQAERAQRAAVLLRLSDRRPGLGHDDARHDSTASGSGVSATAAASSRGAATAVGLAAASSARGVRDSGSTSEMDFPRERATSSGRRSRLRPSTVAFAMLIGLVGPMLFASTARIAASSSTARTPPPAITPVPSLAGRRTTRAASN